MSIIVSRTSQVVVITPHKMKLLLLLCFLLGLTLSHSSPSMPRVIARLGEARARAVNNIALFRANHPQLFHPRIKREFCSEEEMREAPSDSDAKMREVEDETENLLDDLEGALARDAEAEAHIRPHTHIHQHGFQTPLILPQHQQQFSPLNGLHLNNFNLHQNQGFQHQPFIPQHTALNQQQINGFGAGGVFRQNPQSEDENLDETGNNFRNLPTPVFDPFNQQAQVMDFLNRHQIHHHVLPQNLPLPQPLPQSQQFRAHAENANTLHFIENIQNELEELRQAEMAEMHRSLDSNLQRPYLLDLPEHREEKFRRSIEADPIEMLLKKERELVTALQASSSGEKSH